MTETNYNISYWTPAQMVAHHASNGCNLEPGYLFGSGTVSGPTDEARATIAELSERETTPLNINGEERLWLEDGDKINFRARANRDGTSRPDLEIAEDASIPPSNGRAQIEPVENSRLMSAFGGGLIGPP